MSTIKRIEVSFPDPVLERSAALDGQTLTRVAHLNYVVDQINDTFNYSVLAFGIINPIDGSNVPGLIGVGERGTAGSVNGGCRPGTQPYTYSNGSTGCINATLRTAYGNYLPVVAKTDVGIYTFTFPTAPPLGYDVLLSPPSALNGARISLVKTSASVFTITATNADGAAADALLTGMYLELKIYK